VRRALPWLLPFLGLLAIGLLLAPPDGRADDRARKPLMDAPTREAIERGLRFLVRTQNADGSWTSDAGNKVNEEYAVPQGQQNVHHVGVTALGILAFIAAGHVPGRGPYGAVVDRAVAFLLSRVATDGFVAADGTRMYSHAFATLAMAEVYGMSKAPDLRARAQAAVGFTAKCQNLRRWRYVPGGRQRHDVTVRQMTAPAPRATSASGSSSRPSTPRSSTSSRARSRPTATRIATRSARSSTSRPARTATARRSR
jgi:hypothetical protein